MDTPKQSCEKHFRFLIPPINQPSMAPNRFNNIYRKELTGLCSSVLSRSRLYVFHVRFHMILVFHLDRSDVLKRIKQFY